MRQIIINGGKRLTGEIQISGAKNSVVALLPAALLADTTSVIKNVPNISDRDALFDIIKHLNVDISMKNSIVTINPENLINKTIPEDLSHKLRASYYFIGVLLAKYKYVEVYFPGGCNIGARPIDIHLKGFEALGAKITHDENTHKYIISAKKLKGCKIPLKFASVGATLNIMFAATKAEGTTIIENAAKEPEIVNVADFLNQMGAQISGAGTSTITINGVEKLHGTQIEALSDRIETGTYLIIGALLGDNLRIKGAIAAHNEVLLKKFTDMNIDYKIEKNDIIINKAKTIKPINIKTLVYPGFPTDLGQIMSVLLTQANGKSLFEETIWENRMQHIPYLNLMGAGIKQIDNTHLIIEGPKNLIASDINATDLRGGAALVVAGLIAKGTTRISNIEYILRGYAEIIKKLKNVGADINITDD